MKVLENRHGGQPMSPMHSVVLARLALLVSIVLSGFSAAGPLQAQQSATPLYDTKVYFPGTKSYYEMVLVRSGDSIRGPSIPEIGWKKAHLRASERSYKGTRGRLAVVRTPELNRFLMESFRPNQAVWIGLRYWCKFNRLQWVDGKFHDRKNWANWDVQWNQQGVNRGSNVGTRGCGRKDEFWPVHYWPVRDGFRWNATGNDKEFYAYFVEYPTGKE